MSQIKEWIDQVQQMRPEQLQQYLESFSALGPIPGIAAPFLESLLPFLPLLLIIAANANIYGLGLGILYSWAGVCCGCILVFWLSRKLGGGFKGWLQRKFPASAKFFLTGLKNAALHPFSFSPASLSLLLSLLISHPG